MMIGSRLVRSAATSSGAAVVSSSRRRRPRFATSSLTGQIPSAAGGNASCVSSNGAGFSSLPQPQLEEDDDEPSGIYHKSTASPVHIDRVGPVGANIATTQRIGVQAQVEVSVSAVSPRLQQLRDRLAIENRNGMFPDLIMPKATSLGTGRGDSGDLNGSPGELHDGAILKSEDGASALAAEKGEESEPSWKELLQIAKANAHLLPSPTDDAASMLTDSYSRHHTYLRISLSERCNLRCKYCMPPEGVPLSPKEETLSDEEILDLVGLFVKGGVDKVRLTGGEPLLRPTLPHLISSITTQNPTINSVGITTNGLTLSRQLPTLLDAGLTHANISLDTLVEDKFVDITRRKGLDKVLRAIDDAVHQFGEKYGQDTPGRVKINCVVMNGFNDDELRDFVMLTKDRKVDVRFIEWMPFNDNGWNKGRFLGYQDMLERIRGGQDEIEDEKEDSGRGNGISIGPLNLQRLTDGPNDTTKWWSVPGHLGRIGFITSMSNNFCGTCNRLRITADGQLKVCLFGSREVSLRDAMRDPSTSTEDLALLVQAAVSRKTFALGGHGSAEGIRKANDNRPMTLIGG